MKRSDLSGETLPLLLFLRPQTLLANELIDTGIGIVGQEESPLFPFDDFHDRRQREAHAIVYFPVILEPDTEGQVARKIQRVLEFPNDRFRRQVFCR